MALGVGLQGCSVTAGSTALVGSVYGVEPTGHVTELSVKAGSGLIEVKADRDYRAALDSPVEIALDHARICLFDSETGQRLR